MNYRKYKIRTCRWLNGCNLCGMNIVAGEKYYDGGSNLRAHLICNDITGGLEFVRWMKNRGEAYKNLCIKFYQDGEPYFSSQGAEMSLSEFLKRKEESSLT